MSGGGVAGILLILLLVVALFIAASCVKIVPQASAYVVESLGKYKDTWATGLHFKVPFKQEKEDTKYVIVHETEKRMMA